MTRDQVVTGVREDGVREKLLEDKKSSLQNVWSQAEPYETLKQQYYSVSSKSDNTGAEVNRIAAKQGKQNPRKVSNPRGFHRSGNVTDKKCARCGKSPMHGRKDCPVKDHA